MTKAQDYDEVAGEFQAYLEGAVTEWTLGYPAVLVAIEPVAGKRVLDFGCGAGNFARVLSGRGATVVGVDVSQKMIERAEANSGGVRFQAIGEGGLGAMQLQEFDAAVANFVLCTMPSEDEVISVLKAIRETLVSGGTFVAMNTNWEKCNGSDFASFKLDKVESLKSGQRIGLYLKSSPPVRIEDYFWSHADYRKFFERAGFSNVSVSEIVVERDDDRFIDENKTSPFFLVIGQS